MGSRDNLRPPTSTAEARERGRRGGIASGKARVTRRLIRERLTTILTMPADVDGMESADQMDAVLVGLIRRAQQGDTRAAALVLHLIGITTTDPEEEKLLRAQTRRLTAEINAADAKAHPEPITVTMSAEAAELAE